MGFLDVLKSVGDAVNPLSPVVNGVASLGTSLINSHSQKEANKRNAEQNELSREFSAQQAQLDRDFNAEQSDKQNAFNAAEAAKSRVFNADQAKRQMEFQEKMWNAQNEYNDPSAQIARLKAAGINPNWNDGLDNTAGSVSGGAAATSSPASGSLASHGSVGAPSNIPMSPVTIDNPLMMGAQIRLANAQAEKAEQDAKRTQTLTPYEVDTEKANAKFIGAQTELSESNKKVAETQIDKLKSDIQLNNDQMRSNEVVRALNSANKDEKERANKLFDATFEEAVRQFKLQTGLIIANKNELLSRVKSNIAQAGLLDAQADSYAFSNFWNNAKIDFYRQNKGVFSATIEAEADATKSQFIFDASDSQRGFWKNMPYLENGSDSFSQNMLRATDAFFSLFGHNISLLKFGK